MKVTENRVFFDKAENSVFFEEPIPHNYPMSFIEKLLL